MIIQFSFWDIDRITNNSEESDDILTRTPSVPRERVEVTNLAEAKAARAVYAAKAHTTGKRGRVLTHKPYQKARSFSGFGAFEKTSILVNEEVGRNG